ALSGRRVSDDRNPWLRPQGALRQGRDEAPLAGCALRAMIAATGECLPSPRLAPSAPESAVSHRARLSFVGSCVLVALAAELPAQRGGGRRRPEAVLERVSCYLVDGKLPAHTAANAGEDRVAAVGAVADARTRHELALVSLFDSKVDAEKRAAFEKTMFGNEELGIALRCFQTARVDIAGDDDAQAKYGRRLPLFLAFDENGKQAGEAALARSKSAGPPVLGVLRKAGGGPR